MFTPSPFKIPEILKLFLYSQDHIKFHSLLFTELIFWHSFPFKMLAMSNMFSWPSVDIVHSVKWEYISQIYFQEMH